MKKIHLQTITSTNDYAKEIMDTIAENTLITTDYQTHGRGHFSRHWLSAKKENFLGTFVIKSFLSMPQALMIATLSVIDVLDTYALNGEIKLPNDIYIKHKKIAGILIEKNHPNTYCLLGIGVNLNGYEETLATKATSLKEQLKQSIDIDDFTNRLIRTFEKNYHMTSQDLFIRFRKNVFKTQQVYEGEKGIESLQDIDENLNCKTKSSWVPCQKLAFLKHEKRNNYK